MSASGASGAAAPVSQGALRVLFCFGVTQCFFDQDADRRAQLRDAMVDAYRDLPGRFGVTVLGTIDDDRLMVGPSEAWPWTAYVLADAPDLDAVIGVCDILRTPFGSHRLARYMRIEARIGQRLFFVSE